MLLLGLDPGSRYTGWGALQVEGDRLSARAHGRIRLGDGELPTRLERLQAELGSLLDELEPDLAVLETAFHGPNTRSLVVLAQARGALIAALAGRGVEIVEYTPAEVKSAVAGHGGADKGQVQKMVRILLQLDQARISRDASDALAVAICAAHRRRLDRLAGRGQD